MAANWSSRARAWTSLALPVTPCSAATTDSPATSSSRASLALSKKSPKNNSAAAVWVAFTDLETVFLDFPSAGIGFPVFLDSFLKNVAIVLACTGRKTSLVGEDGGGSDEMAAVTPVSMLASCSGAAATNSLAS